ncbi:usher protein (plasmid) [Novosphingobium pentaromativorans US6-1]|uniref:Outer membrane usher protein n=2 Tax=Novosphingobium pentaromativorans TaxID=205844 RepID=G6EH68_9SPHN|nr:usher protein [Novosphingobium pentaromativorans US6-1]EHJ59357.1 outer membrane usher protein [Novosphingobium pentaromativorans US6-1]
MAPVAGLVPFASVNAHADDAPEQMTRGSDIRSSLRLHLELVVNGRRASGLVPVTLQDGRITVVARDLRDAGIDRDWATDAEVDLTTEPGVDVTYSQADQTLLLTVPPHWLHGDHLAIVPGRSRIAPQSDFGALVNYDLYVAHSGQGSHGSLCSEQRVFGRLGTISNTGNLRLGPSGGTGRYLRYETRWTYVDDSAIRTYEAGDLVTRTLPWMNPVRLGGAQVSRDFSVRPDVVTYPLPGFSGLAAVPSALELFVNGYRAAATTVQPGPFVVDELPYVNGAGEATVITTDAQGRQVQSSAAFYVASSLLRPGLTDYAFSLGKLRRNFGASSADYGDWAASASGRLGLTPYLTVEASAEASEEHRLVGAGGILRLGNLGVFDGSVSISRQKGRDGSQVVLGYQYSGRGFNLMARAVRRSTGYGDLSSYEAAQFRLPNRQWQAQANVVLGKGLGSLAASYVETSQGDARFRLANLSYYKSLWGRSSLHLSAVSDIERGTTSAMAQWVVPLGRQGSAVAGIEKTPRGNSRAVVDYGRAVPSEGGLGWSAGASHARGERDRYRADLTWRSTALQVQGGIFGAGARTSTWGEVSGSLVIMDGDVFASNRINDAFALVSTDGVAGVPVHYENQKVGMTDSKGHLLIARVPSYYAASFAIDTRDLPVDAQVPVTTQRSAVKNGSGRLLHFPVLRSRAARILLIGKDGAALAAGSKVTAATGEETWVGLDGRAFLQDLQDSNSLSVVMADGTRCNAAFEYTITDPGVGRVGPLSCR